MSDDKIVLVIGEHFYTESARMRQLAAEQHLAAAGIASRPSLWGRIKSWLKR